MEPAPTATPTIRVIAGPAGRHVIAERPFAAGEEVLRFAGVVTRRPRRYSLQIGRERHLDVPADLGAAEQALRYPWSFLDHACEPNCRVAGRRLLAVRPIAKGEVVSFHYATTEWDMAEPFACHCGSERCLGVVRGWKWLGEEERERLRGWAAGWLVGMG